MLRAGIVGYGRWGPNLARCFAADPDCRLTAICDIAPDRLAAASGDHPQARLQRDWHALIRDPDITAVAIATPPHLHFEMAIAALGAGKHVLVEKPIALCARDVRALIDKAERDERVLLVDHTYAYSPAVREIRKLVDSDALGTIRHFKSLRANADLTHRDTDVLWDLGPHDLSIIDFVFGPGPGAIRASGEARAPNGRLSSAALDIDFPGAFATHIGLRWSAPAKARRIEIVGTRGTLIFDDLEPTEKLKLYGGVGSARDGARIVAVPNDEPLRVLVRHFASCILRRATPLTGGTAGLRVVRWLEAADRSLAAAGAVMMDAGLRQMDVAPAQLGST